MASGGPNNPGTMANDDSVGDVAWTNPDNAKVSDDNYAFSALNNQTTHYLKATNFGFSIPTGATIDGIKVEIEQNYGIAESIENSIRIVKGGTISGDNKSTGATLPASDAYVEYGGSADLWGLSWTADNINNSGFGVVYSVKEINVVLSVVSVDHIRITVYYTEAGWTNQSKSTAISPTNQTKNDISPTNLTKNDSTFTNQAKT